MKEGLVSLLWCLLLLLLCCCWKTCHAQQLFGSSSGSSNIESVFGKDGHSDCPCLENMDYFPLSEFDTQSVVGRFTNNTFNASTYGLGCGTHDVDTYDCIPIDCTGMFPRPASVCDRSWCQRPWCYVDPFHCGLMQRESKLFPQTVRFYSYATCGQMDHFTRENRLSSLEGRTLRVGFNSNTGGWMGAYATDRQHFGKPLEKWSGPVVEFVQEAALHGGFQIQITEPPADLRNKSNEFFDGTSSFDYCVYATALGYLDMCVASYTVTNIRASVTDFMILESSSVYLIANPRYQNAGGWTEFRTSAWKAFAPFTVRTWLFIVFVVIPIFALLTVVHEYGQRGSTLPSEHKVIITKPDRTKELVMQPIPISSAFFTSLYQMFLAFFSWAWNQPVVTTGAKLNLLGIAFFNLTTLVAYTANLAAIFGSGEQLGTIITRNYRFCAERKRMLTITQTKAALSPDMFVVDDQGDGRPGFACCQPRTRVFEMIDPVKADTDPRYCHAAMAPLEDLEVLQADGMFCSLSAIGAPVQTIESGFPIAGKIAPALMSLFLRLKNDGIDLEKVHAARPLSTCPVQESGAGTSLTIVSLAGIWLVTSLFVLPGLLVTSVMWIRRQRWRQQQRQENYKRDDGDLQQSEQRKSTEPDQPGRRSLSRSTSNHYHRREQFVTKRDQNSNAIDALFHADDHELLVLSMHQLSMHSHLENNNLNTLNRMSSHRRNRVLLRLTDFESTSVVREHRSKASDDNDVKWS